MLSEAGVARAIDIRRYPASRKWPHFNADALAKSLPAAGIVYVAMPELGGRRQSSKNSRHTAWKSDTFRAYADFLETPEARSALLRLEEAAGALPSAFFCAEAVPWRCHRSLVADALAAKGWTVTDLLAVGDSRPHALPSFARVEDGQVVYDGGVLPLG